MGLYASVVLVIGKFVREFFSGISHSIMFEELPCVDRILKLCTDIFLVSAPARLRPPPGCGGSCDAVVAGEGDGGAGAGGGAVRQADLLVPVPRDAGQVEPPLTASSLTSHPPLTDWSPPKVRLVSLVLTPSA